MHCPVLLPSPKVLGDTISQTNIYISQGVVTHSTTSLNRLLTKHDPPGSRVYPRYDSERNVYSCMLCSIHYLRRFEQLAAFPNMRNVIWPS